VDQPAAAVIRAALHGVLVIDKPAALTSAAVVARVRRALAAQGVQKAGHTGTLDPLATGVLPLVLGEATKLAAHLLSDEKGYQAEAILGVETDTLDADGAVTARDPDAAARVTADALRAALARFTGAIEQVPPMYSALKRDGRPLHELAREGQHVDRAPRAVTVHRLDLLAYEPPRVTLAIECSKGTYVRTLVADLGRALGAGAHLAALRRTRAGAFTLADAIPLDAVLADPRAAVARVIPPPRALGLPAITVEPAHLPFLATGRVPDDLAAPPAGDLVQLLTPDGDLLAIAACSGGRLELARVFTYGLTAGDRSRKVRAS
jgi:tRNA pseudouridine55 synthase